MDTSFSQTNPPVYVPDQGLGRQALLAVVGERQLNLGGVEFSLDGKEIEKNQKFAQETIWHTNCSLYDGQWESEVKDQLFSNLVNEREGILWFRLVPSFVGIGKGVLVAQHWLPVLWAVHRAVVEYVGVEGEKI